MAAVAVAIVGDAPMLVGYGRYGFNAVVSVDVEHQRRVDEHGRGSKATLHVEPRETPSASRENNHVVLLQKGSTRVNH